MRKTIFISSTFEDLKNYRRKAWDLLENYDVSIRGMERFGARKEAPLTTCLAEVEQSDIFVGIIGFKLGSVEKSSGKSFVQREYERAYELEKELLIYLIDEKNSRVSIQDIDFQEKREKLLSFKSVLKERHTVDFFVSEEDLETKLKRKFDDLLASKEEIKEPATDEYVETKDIINKFLLLPKTYSGHVIRLKVDFVDSPFPASKAVCNNFILEYGRTIGVEVKIKKPKIKSSFVDYIFIDEDNLSEFFSLQNKSDVEIYAKLKWTENEIERVRANFIRQVYYTGGLQLTSASIAGLGHDWERSLLGEKKVVEAEGTIIMLLSEFI